MKFKKLLASFFLLCYLCTQFLGTYAQTAYAAGSCGSTSDLYQGKYLTGCYLININGHTVSGSGWDCGPGEQCYYFDQYKGICGQDFYTDSSGKQHITFCSVSQFSSSQVADGFPGCRFGETCMVGGYVGTQSCNWVVDQGQLKFCAGGFANADALKSSKLSFECVGGNCGSILHNAFAKTEFTMSDAAIGSADDGYFTCYNTNFDPHVQDVIDFYSKLGAGTCIAAIAGTIVVAAPTVGGLLSGSAVVGDIGAAGSLGTEAVAAGDISGATYAAGQAATGLAKVAAVAAIPVSFAVGAVKGCFDAAAMYRPTFQGTVTRSDGSVACMRQLTVKLDANGNTTPVENNPDSSNFNLCDQISPTDSQGHPNPARSDCDACDSQQRVWTAIGCIDPSFKSITQTLIQVGLSVTGGFALLIILAAAFMLTTSQGDLKRAGEARELLTSAVIGLLFIIFSVAILQFIGLNILQIPGFGAGG